MYIKSRLDRASKSIPLNIAEGNGKYTAADRCRFVSMLVGLIRSTSQSRVYEDSAEYYTKRTEYDDYD